MRSHTPQHPLGVPGLCRLRPNGPASSSPSRQEPPNPQGIYRSGHPTASSVCLAQGFASISTCGHVGTGCGSHGEVSEQTQPEGARHGRSSSHWHTGLFSRRYDPRRYVCHASSTLLRPGSPQVMHLGMSGPMNHYQPQSLRKGEQSSRRRESVHNVHTPLAGQRRDERNLLGRQEAAIG